MRLFTLRVRFFPVRSVMVGNFEIRKLHANTLANLLLLLLQQQQSNSRACWLAVVQCACDGPRAVALNVHAYRDEDEWCLIFKTFN